MMGMSKFQKIKKTKNQESKPTKGRSDSGGKTRNPLDFARGK